MVMKSSLAWRKNNRREVINTWERYLAIMAIIALGVGFFAGLKVTKTAMVNNLDAYVNEYNMYDYRLISSFGLTDDDLKYFNNMDGIIAEGEISVDFIAEFNVGGEDKGVVLIAHTITESVNNLNLIKGRMPETSNECVLDASVFTDEIINQNIQISLDNNEDTLELFNHKEYTVVGLADSVNYLNYDRGTTSLASGSIFGFVYLPKEGFNSDYYTDIMLRLEYIDKQSYQEGSWQNSKHGQGEVKVYSDEYNDIISEKEVKIKEALQYRADLRYRKIAAEAQEALVDAQKEYDEGYDDYLSEKADVEAKLRDAWLELEDAKEKITDNEKKLKDGEIQIAEAYEEYLEGVQSYEDGLDKYEREKEELLATLESKQNELDANKEEVVAAITLIEESGVQTQYEQLHVAIPELEQTLLYINDPSSSEYLTVLASLNQAKEAVAEIEASGVMEQYAMLLDSRAQIDEGQKKLNEAKEEAEAGFAKAEKELRDAKEKLDSGYKEIERNKQQLEEGWETLNEGKTQYQEGLLEYEDGKKEAEEGFTKAEEELAEARIKLADAKKGIDNIKEPKTFVLDRNYNSGYVNFDNDSSIVDGIAEILPLYFFLVAALVCSTTMTRMVDEQRTQIGTLKALGYGNGAISRKYMSYSGSAALIGCVLGYILGTKFFPMAIWEAYGMLYGFAPIDYVFDIKLAIICLIVSLLCSAGVTFISCRKELLKMPASLIRPKAPKAGKRVLLERIPLIWRRVSFLHKVSIRNIFRYKRRFFMTVIGIAGCTSLIVGALGIRDSIKNIANDQFGNIMTYDYNISFAEELTEVDRESFYNTYKEDLSECILIANDKVDLIHENALKQVSVVATDDPEITKVIDLSLDGEDVLYPEYNKVILSNKIADEMDIEAGDYISFHISPTEIASVEVSGVFENYVGNYMFMTGETYKALFGEEPKYNNAYAKTNKENLYQVSANLLNDDNVVAVTVTNDIRVTVDNMMVSLDGVIWLVVICAGTLGFVVIYNLNNINITERCREIATLKVIGFYQNETLSYVFRETITLTCIGALVGLGLGKLLHMFIMNEISVEMVSFKEQIFGISYLISFLATITVTLLVNIILRKKIEKINMAESLKSVE